MKIEGNSRKGVFILMVGIVLFAMALSCNRKKDVTSGKSEPVTLSPEVKTLRSAISTANYIGTEQISRKPVMDPNYANRLKLWRLASDDELLILSGDTNAVVALTAFEGLYQRGNKVVPVIFDGYLKRSDIISYLKGDIAHRMPMIEYAYVYIMHYPMPDEKLPEEVEFEEPNFALSDAKKDEAYLKITELRALEDSPRR